MPVQDQGSSRWSDEQISNAKAISRAGASVGASQRDVLIALMTAFQESGLRNLSYGDRDSIGLFQQRNAWGSRGERMDPMKSARMFFVGGNGGQRGLLDFNQRNQWSLTQAAQKVQVSAYPDAYAKHESRAKEMLGLVGFSASTVQRTPEHDANEPLDTMLGVNPRTGLPMEPTGTPGIEAPKPAPSEPLGLSSPGAPGIERGDEQPSYEFGTSAMSLTGATGEDLFDLSQASASDPSGTGATYGGNEGARGDYNLPGVKSYVLNAANELGGRWGIKSIGGVGDRPNKSDHPGGKALDFMVRGNSGNQLAAYAMTNAERLNVKYIIWNKRIWSVGKSSKGWRPMEDRGGDTANHVDHVHISFN